MYKLITSLLILTFASIFASGISGCISTQEIQNKLILSSDKKYLLPADKQFETDKWASITVDRSTKKLVQQLSKPTKENTFQTAILFNIDTTHRPKWLKSSDVSNDDYRLTVPIHEMLIISSEWMIKKWTNNGLVKSGSVKPISISVYVENISHYTSKGGFTEQPQADLELVAYSTELGIEKRIQLNNIKGKTYYIFGDNFKKQSMAYSKTFYLAMLIALNNALVEISNDI